MEDILKIVLAILMALILFASGAAAQIIGGLGATMGAGGALAGVLIVIAMILAVFNKK